MKFMNEYEVRLMVAKYRSHQPYSPSLHRAALLLESFMNAVNTMSDGWAYWSPAPRAARRLMEVLEQPPKDENDRYEMVRTAERPIKTLCTKHSGLPKDTIWAPIYAAGL